MLVLKVPAGVPFMIDIKSLLGYLLKGIKHLLRYTPFMINKYLLGNHLKYDEYDEYKVTVGVSDEVHPI